MTGTVIERPRNAACDTPTDELTSLQTRVARLERERDQLLAVVDILQAISASPNYSDILQTVARELGGTFSLDRCSIFLSSCWREARLVATYEDPTLTNLIVDPERYPELKHALDSSETVFISDASAEPKLSAARAALQLGHVRSIVVVPIRWRGVTIGAILLRTAQGAPAFTDRDLQFCEVIASLTARVLSDAWRSEPQLRGRRAPEAPRTSP